MPMESSSLGVSSVPTRLFSIRTRLPFLVVEKRSVTALPRPVAIDVWKGAAVEWEAAGFGGYPAFSFPTEKTLDVEPGHSHAIEYLRSLFTPEEASATLDMLAAEVPSGTHTLTAVELPITDSAISEPHLHRRSSGWGRALGRKVSDERGALLYGYYSLCTEEHTAEYVETIDPSEVDVPTTATQIRPLSDLEDAAQAGREHVDPPPKRGLPF